MNEIMPGWEGAQGPFMGERHKPHVYARDIHSGAGNCVCGGALEDRRHVQAAPGVPIPNTMRRTEYNGPLRQGSQVGRNLYLTDVPGVDGFVAVTLGPTEYAFEMALWLVEAAHRHHHAGHPIPLL